MPGPRDYPSATRAALAMLSRGRCYFPGCDAAIMRFIEGEPYIDYQIAHIRDARPGNRFDETMTDEERRAFSNLILLCKPHHELVDVRHPDRHSVEDLEHWKRVREGATAVQLSEVGPVTEEELADLLAQSLSEAQAEITRALRDQDADVLNRMLAVREDASFARVYDALAAAEELSLLSRLGVRSRASLNEFYLRIQKTDDALVVNLDTSDEASVFSEDWGAGQSFAQVMLRLANQVRPTSYWPGAERWEFESAMASLVGVLVAGCRLKARGGWIANAVQLVGTTWLLSDWEALEVAHGYQILYSRLGALNWFSHVAGKSWADRDEVAEMLDQAEFLRDLAAAEESAAAVQQRPTGPIA